MTKLYDEVFAAESLCLASGKAAWNKEQGTGHTACAAGPPGATPSTFAKGDKFSSVCVLGVDDASDADEGAGSVREGSYITCNAFSISSMACLRSFLNSTMRVRAVRIA